LSAGAVEARTLIAAAELIPVLNASEAASDGFAAACLLPKIRAQRLRSAMRAFFTALLSLRSSSSSESSLRKHPDRHHHLPHHRRVRLLPRRRPLIVFGIIITLVFRATGFRFLAFLSSSLRKPTRHVQEGEQN
jgi:hypothetical protein